MTDESIEKPSCAMDIDSSLARCRSLVLLERILYLNRVEADSILSVNLLDRHQHQTILRVCYEIDRENFQDKLRSYFLSYQKRMEILEEIIVVTKKELYELYPHYQNFVSPHENLTTTREKIAVEFKKIVRSSFLNRELHFINRYGFAVFPEIEIDSKEYGFVSKITNSKFVSVGGLMYYGFNVKSYPVYCYQMSSISVLAATLYLYSQEDLPVLKNHNWWALGAQKEMLHLPFASKQYNSILQLTTNVFELHEQGHGLCVNGDKTLYYFLISLGLKDEDFYSTDFATENDLKIWQRVKSGIGSFKDICFLLGDFLSNIASLLAGISPEEEQIMRAVNWGISSPPNVKNRPRGKVSFLRYSLNKDFDNLFSTLEKIFYTVKNCPEKTAQAMQDMDFGSWKILQEYYNV